MPLHQRKLWPAVTSAHLASKSALILACFFTGKAVRLTLLIPGVYVAKQVLSICFIQAVLSIQKRSNYIFRYLNQDIFLFPDICLLSIVRSLQSYNILYLKLRMTRPKYSSSLYLKIEKTHIFLSIIPSLNYSPVQRSTRNNSVMVEPYIEYLKFLLH